MNQDILLPKTEQQVGTPCPLKSRYVVSQGNQVGWSHEAENLVSLPSPAITATLLSFRETPTCLSWPPHFAQR